MAIWRCNSGHCRRKAASGVTVYRTDLDEITNPAFQEKVRMSEEAQLTKQALQEGSRNLKLLSDGGVHSLQSHLHGMIDAALRLGASNIFVHAILDGRDTPPKSAERLEARRKPAAGENPEATPGRPTCAGRRTRSIGRTPCRWRRELCLVETWLKLYHWIFFPAGATLSV